MICKDMSGAAMQQREFEFLQFYVKFFCILVTQKITSNLNYSCSYPQNVLKSF